MPDTRVHEIFGAAAAEPAARPDGIEDTISERLVVQCVIAFEGLVWFATGLLAMGSGTMQAKSVYAVLASLAGSLAACMLSRLAGAYELRRFHAANGLVRAFLGWALASGALYALMILAEPRYDFDRFTLAAGSATALVLIAVFRLHLRFRVGRWRRQGRLAIRVAVVGTGPVAVRLLRFVATSEPKSFRIVGVYDDDAKHLPTHCMGQPIRGTLDDLVRDARRLSIGTVLVAQPLAADRLLIETMDKLRQIPADVRLCPDNFGLRLRSVGVSQLGGLTFLNAVDRPLRDWMWVLKAIEDRVLAFLILLLIAPVLLVVSILLKLDSPGPVLFRQRRYGYNNQLFEVLKFRTMYHDARDERGEQLTRRNDARITRLGRFLRRTSVDELPQFLNVLRGEMSIVGPRPHALSAKAGSLLYHEAVKYYDARHRVKPGITGWAQVNGWRGETDTVEQIRKRVEHDLYYIEHWSLLFDLEIIARTILVAFNGRHAF